MPSTLTLTVLSHVEIRKLFRISSQASADSGPFEGRLELVRVVDSFSITQPLVGRRGGAEHWISVRGVRTIAGPVP